MPAILNTAIRHKIKCNAERAAHMNLSNIHQSQKGSRDYILGLGLESKLEMVLDPLYESRYVCPLFGSFITMTSGIYNNLNSNSVIRFCYPFDYLLDHRNNQIRGILNTVS